MLAAALVIIPNGIGLTDCFKRMLFSYFKPYSYVKHMSRPSYAAWPGHVSGKQPWQRFAHFSAIHFSLQELHSVLSIQHSLLSSSSIEDLLAL